jgi:hypothetical protein
LSPERFVGESIERSQTVPLLCQDPFGTLVLETSSSMLTAPVIFPDASKSGVG